MNKKIIIGVILIFILVSIIYISSGNSEWNTNITYEEKIRNISYDEEYGKVILDNHDITFKSDGLGGYSDSIIHNEVGSITFFEEIYVYASYTFAEATLTLEDNSLSVIRNYSELDDKEILKWGTDKKEYIDLYYNEYIESKYACTYNVDCSIWDNFS